MAEPFVFHFRPGPTGPTTGQPEAMYIADLLGVCGLCRHEQIQRFYHSAPFHGLTIERLVAIATDAHNKAGFECENCGSAVGPEHVREAVVTWGFADDAGLIRLFVHRPEDGPARHRYQLVPSRRLDPQELPGWAPKEGQGPVVDRLDEGVVEEHLGRVFNPKLAILELIEDWRDDPEGGAYARLAPGMWALVEADLDALGELAGEIDAPGFAEAVASGDLVAFDLLDAVPHGLATHTHPARIAGCPQSWLPPSLLDAMRAGEYAVRVYISREAMLEPLLRAFQVANLSFERGEDRLRDITTPTGVGYPEDLLLAPILRRAAYTGITPGDAGRLTAEEVVGTLLRVWKPYESRSGARP